MNEYNIVFRCAIHGTIKVSKEEIKIIDHPVFQRLRWISQLGMVYKVFPSATHTRFSHSLGVLHIANRIFNQLVKEDSSLINIIGERNSKYLRRIIRLAALLHDIGHLPFSHSIEKIFPKANDLVDSDFFLRLDNFSKTKKLTHEDFSIILINQLIKNKLIDELTCRLIIDIITGNPSNIKDNFIFKGYDVYGLAMGIINSQIDADRMDYLLRDSHHSGVAYGKFDIDHIIRSIGIYQDKNKKRIFLLLKEEGLLAYQDLLNSRQLMFAQVYCHRSVLVLEELLKRAITEDIKLNIFESIDNYINSGDYTIIDLIVKNRNKKWCKLLYAKYSIKNIVRLFDPTINERKIITKIKNKLDEKKISYYHTNRKVGFYRGHKSYPIYIKIDNFGQEEIKLLTKQITDKGKDLIVNQLSVDVKDYDKALRITKE